MTRQINYQSISWFWDHYKRELLELDPPYQRRSVWNQEYKDYFIDTILNGYPAPAIFLYQEITPDGVSKYSVVDGKQRLSAIFDFVQNIFPVSETSTVSRLRNRYFKDLDDRVKGEFWKYQFSVEYLESSDEDIINNIFDRINRNVAKLTSQELRHAKFDGEFINEAENLTIWMIDTLPKNFPAITQRTRKQMKDVEITAQLLLLIEEGPKTYSQDDLDKAFSDRDTAWENKEEVVNKFRRIIDALLRIVNGPQGAILMRSRLRNQADFYSLFGAIYEILEDGQQVPEGADGRLLDFIVIVEDENRRRDNRMAADYYDAARSASNDAGPRRRRINIIKSVIENNLQQEGRA